MVEGGVSGGGREWWRGGSGSTGRSSPFAHGGTGRLKPCACGGAGPSSVGIVGVVLSS